MRPLTEVAAEVRRERRANLFAKAQKKAKEIMNKRFDVFYDNGSGYFEYIATVKAASAQGAAQAEADKFRWQTTVCATAVGADANGDPGAIKAVVAVL